MNEHTPGPWELDGDCFPLIINGPEEGDSNVVATIETCATPNVSKYHYNEERACANARLIAAAPEMLDALVALVANNYGALDTARAIIAKVRS